MPAERFPLGRSKNRIQFRPHERYVQTYEQYGDALSVPATDDRVEPATAIIRMPLLFGRRFICKSFVLR